jgi:hypothetical protein
MKRFYSTVMILGILIFSGSAMFGDVTCAIHNAPCYDTGYVASSGAHKYHCSCGDDVWVAR